MRVGSVVDYDAMTIEHLAPQNPDGGVALPESAIGELGNLILVPEKLNIELGNKPFDKKKELLKKADVPLDPVLKSAKKIDEEVIRDRTILLSKLGYEKIFKV